MKWLAKWFPVLHIVGFILFISWSSTSFNPYVEDKRFGWTLGEILDKAQFLLVMYYCAHVLAFINRGSFKGYPEYRALFGPSPAPCKARGLLAGLLLALVVWLGVFCMELYIQALGAAGNTLETRVLVNTLVVLLSFFLDWRFNQFVASRQLLRI